MADEVVGIQGKMNKFKVPKKWAKKPGEEHPCLLKTVKGCTKEGYFVPYLTIWGKNDPKRTGRFVIVIIPVVLCTEHAVTDPKEFVPDATALADVTKKLGTEPDLDTMVVQYLGNEVCRVTRAQELAAEKEGLYEHYYESNPTDGSPAGVRTRKVV